MQRASVDVRTPKPNAPSTTIVHAAATLEHVTVDDYSSELRDDSGLIGEHANSGAFRELLDAARKLARKCWRDPLGETPTQALGKKKLDKLLSEGEPRAAAVIHAAIENFASELAGVIRRLLVLKEWREVERIVVGGGLRDSRVGEIVVSRAALKLREAGRAVALTPIHHHPDEGGLVGAAHLAPGWIFDGHQGIVGVDVGGSNVRVGVVELRSGKGLREGVVRRCELWRHVDEPKPPTRDELVARLGEMLRHAIRWARKHAFDLAPFIGIGCPGRIAADGQIQSGGLHLPGNWVSSRFNLARRVHDMVPEIAGAQSIVVMHNDAVVQGLSELPHMRDVEHWAVLTIGTGLGNAKFTNRRGRAARAPHG